MEEKELTHTKNCKDCFYSVKNLCYIDGHNINYDVHRAYSCKYYKYYENNKQQKIIGINLKEMVLLSLNLL